MQASLILTKEQRSLLAQEMGIICDELLLSELPNGQEIKVSELGNNLFIAAGKTTTTS